MHIYYEELVSAFVLLWAVIDPIGTVPVFIAATHRHPELEMRRIAYQSICAAAGVLLFFLHRDSISRFIIVNLI
jgi:multiple antibiotic resistance protein